MYKWLSSNNLNNLKIIQIKTGIYILNGDRFTKVIVNRQSKITLSISLRARIRITQADPEGGPGGPHSLFELSYRLVKTCFNRIFPISSLSLSFYLSCFVILALNYALVSFYFSQNKLFWNPDISQFISEETNSFGRFVNNYQFAKERKEAWWNQIVQYENSMRNKMGRTAHNTMYIWDTFIKRSYNVHCLTTISTRRKGTWDAKSVTEANGLMTQLTSTTWMVPFCVNLHFSGYLRSLSLLLQGPTLNIIKAHEKINLVKTELKQILAWPPSFALLTNKRVIHSV